MPAVLVESPGFGAPVMSALFSVSVAVSGSKATVPPSFKTSSLLLSVICTPATQTLYSPGAASAAAGSRLNTMASAKTRPSPFLVVRFMQKNPLVIMIVRMIQQDIYKYYTKTPVTSY